MRITGHNRFVFPLLFTVLSAAPPCAAADDTLRALARLAEGLSQNDSGQALSVFDSGMKEFGTISADIEAIAAQAEVLCSIDIVDEKEEGAFHLLDVDWYMVLKSRTDGGPTERRRERVALRMALVKGRWKIVSIAPLRVLDPIAIR